MSFSTDIRSSYVQLIIIQNCGRLRIIVISGNRDRNVVLLRFENCICLYIRFCCSNRALTFSV